MSDAILFHCYCTGVTQKRVLRAMREKGVRAIEDVRLATGACTGCQSCRGELEDLLAAVAEGRVALPAAAVDPTPV